MKNPNTVPILEKALDILEYIGAHPESVTQSELQKALGIPQASCYRIIATLTERNWLNKTDAKSYDISSVFAGVAAKALFRLERYRKLQPVMNRLALLLGHSLKLSVRDGAEFINVCSARTPGDVTLFSEPGFRAPLAEPASVGTIFLAAMPETEQKQLLAPEQWENYETRRREYQQNGCCYQAGSPAPGGRYPVDTLSFPVFDGTNLAGVLSCLALPGRLRNADCDAIRRRIAESVPSLLDVLR